MLRRESRFYFLEHLSPLALLSLSRQNFELFSWSEHNKQDPTIFDLPIAIAKKRLAGKF